MNLEIINFYKNKALMPLSKEIGLHFNTIYNVVNHGKNPSYTTYMKLKSFMEKSQGVKND